MTWNEESFSETCQSVRDNTPSLDRESLLRKLMVQVRRDFGFDHADASYPGQFDTKSDAYLHFIIALVKPNMDPLFDLYKIIRTVLLHEEE